LSQPQIETDVRRFAKQVVVVAAVGAATASAKRKLLAAPSKSIDFIGGFRCSCGMKLQLGWSKNKPTRPYNESIRFNPSS
jgi:hypothetical protein